MAIISRWYAHVHWKVIRFWLKVDVALLYWPLELCKEKHRQSGLHGSPCCREVRCCFEQLGVWNRCSSFMEFIVWTSWRRPSSSRLEVNSQLSAVWLISSACSCWLWLFWAVCFRLPSLFRSSVPRHAVHHDGDVSSWFRAWGEQMLWVTW